MLLLDLRILPQRPQHLLLPLELLQEIGLEIGARGDVGDLEQREQRRMMILRGILRGEVAGAREQVLEPHQRAHSLVQRMFVADHRHWSYDCAPLSGERRRRFKRALAREFAIEGVEARDLAARAPRSGRRCR